METHERPQGPVKDHISRKLIVLALLVGISWIASMFVWGIVQDREHRKGEASEQVSRQWAGPQVIAGPILTVPIQSTHTTPTGENVVEETTLTLLPQNLSYTSKVDTELLDRGVYETPVYTTNVKGSGTFNLSDIGTLPSDMQILWDRATISLNVSDPRGIASTIDLTLNDAEYTMLPSSLFLGLGSNGVHTNLSINPSQNENTFSFELPLKGSNELSFIPLGNSTEVTMSSRWNAPSFTGEFLPDERSVTNNGFEAHWEIASYGRKVQQSWVGQDATQNTNVLNANAFGVSLHQEVNFYTMIDRTTKYSILFISLTFLTFFMYEILAGLRIHPMQYLLVGLAIALFYLLLLSFAEILGFLPAYLIAAVATTTLISTYCFSVLRARNRAASIALLLTALYSYLYILLQMDQYALLSGSVLLFGVLATVMFLTRNLDWYSLSSK